MNPIIICVDNLNRANKSILDALKFLKNASNDIDEYYNNSTNEKNSVVDIIDTSHIIFDIKIITKLLKICDDMLKNDINEVLQLNEFIIDDAAKCELSDESMGDYSEDINTKTEDSEESVIDDDILF